MSLSGGIKRDIKAARKIRLSWQSLLLLGIGSFLVAWLLDQSGRLNLALPLMNSLFVLGFVISIKWEMRAYAWFWGATAIIAALLVALILLIPWGTRWVPAAAIAGVDSIGVCLMFAIYVVAERLGGVREG